jgi:fibronectin-binding autotransporter adhesin
MNRIFRIIWSKALRAWVVASEFATPNGKGGGGADVDARTIASVSLFHRYAARGWPMRVCTVAVLMALHAPTWAADRWWDINGTGVDQGGTGTWNTTSLFWNSFNDGVTGPMDTWDNAAPGGDNAFFMGMAGTVTLAGPMTVHDITFGTNNYTLAGSTLTFTGTTPTINVTTGTSYIDSVVAGTQGITKSGAGGLWLRGANTFLGNITVSAGGIGLASDASLGAASNGIILANGTSITSTALLAASRTVTIQSGVATATGGALTARFTGAGGLNVSGTLSNNANDYTGRTAFGQGTHGFTSVADLGVASALGAPTTAVSGLISSSAGGGIGNALIYSGDGDSSNRDWRFNNTSSGGNTLQNAGTGTLRLTGNIFAAGANWTQMVFSAASADMELLGEISGAAGRQINFSGNSGRTITLGNANTFDGTAVISNITLRAGALANSGTNSSLGSGTAIAFGSGTLSYTGGATSTNRTLSVSGPSTLRNDGTGALSLSGATSFVAGNPVDTLTLGGSFTGTNTFSGVVSGAGNLAMNGSGTWLLSGNNTFTGSTTVQSGTLAAGSVQAFGASTGLIVNGGTLDLNDLAITAPTLSGTGGTVDLGSGMLTLNAAAGSTTYGGSIAGSGSLTKLGGSTLTLTGVNTYTGATNVGAGTLGLSFAGAGGPTSNIISSVSTLNMAGGNLTVTGAAGEANTQAFNGLNVTAGSNRLTTAPAAGGSVTVDVGTITRSGGLIDFGVSATGIVTTDNADGTLGGWATVNGSDYAKVEGGSIIAFTAADYTDKDDAATWLDNEFISDSDGDAFSFSGTVAGNKQLGGLQYTTAANSTVNVGAGQTLGIDGTIIVASSVNNTTKTIQGGNLTGLAGGGTLGVLQNGGATSNFTIASTIVDNGGAIGFSKGGTGLVTLTGANTYTGATTLSGGTLSINSVANGGVASSIGASSAASSNLAIENGALRYTGTSTTTDRGFTLVNGGASRTIEVVNGATNLTFSGQVTSPDDAGFI